MAKKSSGSGTTKVARSAGTGRFVTEKYAKSHPKTTVIETIKGPTGSKPGTKIKK